MADKKITALNASTALSTDDLFHVVDESMLQVPQTRKSPLQMCSTRVPTWIWDLLEHLKHLLVQSMITTPLLYCTSTGAVAYYTCNQDTAGQIKMLVSYCCRVHQLRVTPLLLLTMGIILLPLMQW